MRKAVLLRIKHTPHQTFGIFRVFDGADLLASAYTLELPWKRNERNVSCIPETQDNSEYTLQRHVSPKFGNSFWIKEVPGRSEILMHVANFVASKNPRTNTSDLRGCIGVGKKYKDIDGDGYLDLYQSRKAMEHLVEKLWNNTKDQIPFQVVSTRTLMGLDLSVPLKKVETDE